MDNPGLKQDSANLQKNSTNKTMTLIQRSNTVFKLKVGFKNGTDDKQTENQIKLKCWLQNYKNS